MSKFLLKKFRHPTRPAEDVVRTTKGLQERTQPLEWEDGETENKGNSKFDSNWNLPIGAWNMIFKSTELIIVETHLTVNNLTIKLNMFIKTYFLLSNGIFSLAGSHKGHQCPCYAVRGHTTIGRRTRPQDNCMGYSSKLQKNHRDKGY